MDFDERVVIDPASFLVDSAFGSASLELVNVSGQLDATGGAPDPDTVLVSILIEDFEPDTIGTDDGNGALPAGEERVPAGTRCDTVLEVIDRAGGYPPFRLPESSAVIEVELAQSAQVREPLGAGRFRLGIEPAQRLDLDLSFIVRGIDTVPVGRSTIDLRLVFTDGKGGRIGSEFPLELVIDVAPEAQLNIAGADGAFGTGRLTDTVTFQDPEPGDFRQVFVQARANDTATLSLMSENGSRMLHEDQDGSFIAYSIVADGVTYDLLQTPTVVSTFLPTGAAGHSLPMRIVIGEIEQGFSGDYLDRITVTLTTQ